jgi:hypothetical protein
LSAFIKINGNMRQRFEEKAEIGLYSSSKHGAVKL